MATEQCFQMRAICFVQALKHDLKASFKSNQIDLLIHSLTLWITLLNHTESDLGMYSNTFIHCSQFD